LTVDQSFNVTVSQIPPDPTAIAPAIASNQPFSMMNSTSFLYTGDNPIQTGVSPGTIQAAYAAVVRGRVLDINNNPLSGIFVTLVGHSEFGQTVTQATGYYDLAVNGGSTYVVQMQSQG